MPGRSLRSDGMPNVPANSDRDVVRLTLAELNHEISWTKMRAMRAKDHASRAAIKQRLIWLEAHREKLYGINLRAETGSGLTNVKTQHGRISTIRLFRR